MRTYQEFIEAIMGLNGRRVLAVRELVDGVEIIFDAPFSGNLLTVDADGCVHVGTLNFEWGAEAGDPFCAGLLDRSLGFSADAPLVLR